jgi:hypothetical protein
MSTTVEEFLREARKLTPEERRELAEALMEESGQPAVATGVPDNEEGGVNGSEIRQRRLEWLKAHRDEYGGQHVALDGVALVATGRSYREAREKALSAGKQDVFIAYLPKPDEVAEMGGW